MGTNQATFIFNFEAAFARSKMNKLSRFVKREKPSVPIR
jgi:hypothetical protein